MRCTVGALSLFLVFLAEWPRRPYGFQFAVNSWYVKFKKPVDIVEARAIAGRHGFSCLGSVLTSGDEYHFRHRAVPAIRTRKSVRHTLRLKRVPSIALAVQEIGRVRQKRGYLAKLHEPLTRKSRIASAPVDPLDRAPLDPLFENEWYLKNTGQAGGTPGLDLNVEAAWTRGVTGRNVTVAILDDGVDYLHPDLRENFDAEASYDYSSNDPYPYPRYTEDGFNSHGTRCAGEVAAARDGKQAVGVAYNSKIAGLRILDQPYMTDILESKGLGHMQTAIDIYSASWGPSDNGKTVDGPRELTLRAMAHGINEGRQGKGNIYVWASGDGGPLDNCNCDGYAASMWTISINSVTNTGERATYGESCSSTLASTFSNGKAGYEDSGVVTIDLYGETTFLHSGTSAAAPQAAGVFGLTLEANSNITWRDMQHLVILTSKKSSLHDPHGAHGWRTNGAGFEFNHLFGFGVLDAGDMVDLAHVWRTVPERSHCGVSINLTSRNFTPHYPLKILVDTDSCEGGVNEVNFLEHVQAIMTVKAERRGDISIALTSPMNTRSTLLTKRPQDDDSVYGFNKWPFMSTQCWGENPRGRWTLDVALDSEDDSMVGELSEFSLVLHGTQESPYVNQVASKRHGRLASARRRHAGGKFKKESPRKALREARRASPAFA